MKQFKSIFILVWLCCIGLSCNKPQKAKTLTSTILDWYQFALKADRYTEGFKAPVAARAYAYTAIAAWQAAVAAGAIANEKSLEKQFPALAGFKYQSNQAYHLEAVLDGCYNQIFEKLFLGNPRNIEQERKALYTRHTEAYKNSISEETLIASTDLGKAIALHVHLWATTDSLGNQGQMRNYDPHYVCPKGDSIWQPCEDFPTPTLLPHWGKTRTFTIDVSQYKAGPPIPYSEEPGSPMHKQAMELFILSSPISDENARTAEFWSDDHPSLTFSSAGRWMAITSQILEKEQPEVEQMLRSYLLVSLALSDAFVSCWHSKYAYHLLRPETYIRRTMNPTWRPMMHTPPFPAYPSGHAMVSFACCTVLEHLYGESYQFTDRSHAGRTEFASEPRTYSRILNMAQENSESRIALGVHYRMDCEEGQRLGIEIGKAVLEWDKCR